MRLFLFILLLAVALLSPLLVFGGQWDESFGGASGVAWLRQYGSWAWLAAIGLLMADLVLPIPSTAVMASLGILYGAVVGGLIGAAGSVLVGLTAYLITRSLGRRGARLLVGDRDLGRTEAFFDRAGGWAVALTRPVPLAAEVVACVAGLAGMPARRFMPALACGSLPLGLAFSTLGAVGADRPLLAVTASALAPLALWPIARRLVAAPTDSSASPASDAPN